MVEKVFADWDELSKMLKISFVAEIHRFSLYILTIGSISKIDRGVK